MLRSYLILFTCVFIWACNYLIRQILLREFPPLFLSAFSLSVVSLVFIGWAFIAKSFVRLSRKEMILFGLSAIVGLAANQLFLFNGLKYTTATNASLIFCLSPLITAGFAALILKEEITWRMLAGCMAAMIGLVQVLETEGHLHFHLGDLLMLGATFTFSFNLILVRILSNRLSPIIITVYSFLLSSIIFDPFMLAGVTVDWHHSFKIWGLAVLSVVVAQGLTNVLWTRAMESVGAARSAIVLNLQPLMTMLLDYYFFHYVFTLRQILGAMLVFLGVLVGTWSKETLSREKSRVKSASRKEGKELKEEIYIGKNEIG